MGGNARWWLALGAAALLLMIASGIAVLHRGRSPGTGSATAAAPDAGERAAAAPDETRGPVDACGLPVQVSLSASGEASPVLLWAVTPVRLFLDDKPAFSPPENPLRLSGEHTLRAEATGEEPLSTRFTLSPGAPALFHAQVEPGLGITLVRLGGSCASCDFKDVDVSLDPVPSNEPGFALLQSAASHLRADRWRLALPRLQRVPEKDRNKVPYLRLASNLFHATGEPDRALEYARAIPSARSNDLSTLLDAYETLRRAGDRNSAEGLLSRWNGLTDRFGEVASRFAPDVPGPLSAATRRLQQLSAAFETQLHAKNARALRSTVEAAESTVLQLVHELRATRPSDCDFQKDVVATVTK